MTQPFSSFEVTPTYGAFQASIRYSLAAGLSGDIYFYRSENGVRGWKLLNPGAPATIASGVFADSDLSVKFARTPYYRGVLDPSGEGPETWLTGRVVAPFDHYYPAQRRSISAVLRREYRRMAGLRSDGMPIFHLLPRTDGDLVNYFDAETGQLLGPGCGGESDGLGGRYVGGYYPPVQTWGRLIQVGPLDRTESSDPGPEEKAADAVMRLLAFPPPARGHLIVLPKSDERYAVADPINRYLFPGTNVPIAWEVPLQLLAHDHPAYRVPLPSLLADPLLP